MEGYYEINVSLSGVHYFATAPRSLKEGQVEKAKELYSQLHRLFPESKGFKVTIRHWSVVGAELLWEPVYDLAY